MAKEALVSIGLPTYNGTSKRLRQVIEALLGQTYPVVELIISDNASTDGTEKLCKEYAKRDRRIRYVRQPKNRGPIANFNFVLGEARGDYFMWAADDDLWDQTFIEKCVKKHESDAELSLVFSRFVRIDEHLRTRVEYGPKDYLPIERDLYRRLRHHILLPWSDGKAVPVYGLWRREKIQNDRLEDYVDFGFDMNFVFRALSRGPFGAVDEVLFTKRVNFSDRPTVERGLVGRILNSLWYRLRKVFSPLFYSQVVYLLKFRELPPSRRLALVSLVLFVVLRLFVRRKM